MSKYNKDIIELLKNSDIKLTSKDISKKIEYNGKGKTFYNTIATNLLRLYEKELVDRIKEGNSYKYFIKNNKTEINHNEIQIKQNNNKSKTKFEIEFEKTRDKVFSNQFYEVIKKIPIYNDELIKYFISIKNIKKWFTLADKLYFNIIVKYFININIKKKKFQKDKILKNYLYKLYFKNKHLPYKKKKQNKQKLYKIFKLKYSKVFNIVINKYIKLYNKLHCLNFPEIIINYIDNKVLKGHKNIFTKTEYNLQKCYFDYYVDHNYQHKYLNEPIRWTNYSKKDPSIDIIDISNRDFDNDIYKCFLKNANCSYEDLLNNTNNLEIIENIIKPRFKPTLNNEDIYVKGNITDEFIYIHNKRFVYLFYLIEDSKLSPYIKELEFKCELIDIIE
jgi:predicted transcriptional regulator